MKTELTALERFQENMTQVFAQMYRDALSESVKRGLARRKQNMSTPHSGSVKKSKV